MSRSHCLSVTLIVLCSLLPLLAQSPPPVAQPAKKDPPKLDRYGDPLPEGAVARLGTLRMRHQGRVSSIAYSPDGKMIASVGWDNSVRIWDAKTGKQLHYFAWDESNPRSVAFSPDSARLAVGGGGEIRVWELSSSKVLFAKHRLGGVFAVTFSPDGRTLASGGTRVGRHEGIIQLWELETAQERASLQGHLARVNCLAFSPDGRHLASGSGSEPVPIDASIRIWHVLRAEELAKLEGHKQPVMSLSFSADSTRLLSGGGDALCIWDAKTAKEALRLEHHAYAVSFSPDGKSFAHGGAGGPVQIRDAATGTKIRAMDTLGFGVQALAFSPDGSELSCGCEARIKTWRLDTGEELLRFEGHEAPVRRIMFTPDGKMLASTAGESILLWDLATRKVHRTFETAADGAAPFGKVGRFDISPDGRLLAASTPNNEVLIWELPGGKELCRWKTSQHMGLVAFSPDSKCLAIAGSVPGTVEVHEVATWKQMHRWQPFTISRQRGTEVTAETAMLARISSLAFSVDGTQLAMAGHNGSSSGGIKIFSLATGKLLKTYEHNDLVLNVIFSPGGTALVCAKPAYREDGVLLIDLNENVTRVFTTMERFYPPSTVFSSDGKFVVSTAQNSQYALIHEMLTGKEVRRFPIRDHVIPEGGTKVVSGCALSPDQQTLASAGLDTTIVLHRIPWPQGGK